MNSKYAALFQPYTIGNVTLKNRIGLAPMEAGYVRSNGLINDRLIDLYANIAKGGAGLIITGAVKTHSVTKMPEFVNMHLRENKLRLCALSDAVHAGGAKLCLEVTPGSGRVGLDPDGGPLYSSGTNVDYGFGVPGTCQQMSVEQIKQIMAQTVVAARNIVAGGADMIDIHAHSGYLIDQFLCPHWNNRTDEYGGSLENRMRFFLEYIAALREGVGPNFPIFVRFSVDMRVAKYRSVEESIEVLRMLEKAGIDGIDCDVGCYEAVDHMFPSYMLEDGNYMYACEIVRKAGITLPIMSAGNHTLDTAVQALEGGLVDVALFGRPLLADPDMPNKVLEDQLEDIRPCIKCNMGCVGRNDLRGISCAVNPTISAERRTLFLEPCEGQKVVIIGSGVAGLEAARITAKRGADVTLIEKDARIGGTARTIASPEWKYRFRDLFAWYEVQMKKLGVKVMLNTEATVGMPELKGATAIIVATGTDPIVPNIEGINNANVVNVIDVHRDMSIIKGENIVVCGGGVSACEMAVELGEKGKKVTVVEMMGRFARDVVGINGVTLFKKLAEYGVTLLANTTVKKFTEEGVVVETAGEEKLLPADMAVHAFGIKSNNALGLELMKAYPGRVTIAGDANKVNCIYDALHDGYYAGIAVHGKL